MGNIDFTYLYTSLEGRIGRQSYWIGVVGFIVAGIILSVLIGAIFGMATTAGLIVIFIVQLAFLYPSYALMGKRFQDRDKPASFALIGIGISLLSALLGIFGLTHNELGQPNWLGWILNIALLIVAIWFLIELGFLRGTVGSNQYGSDPLQSPQ